MGLALGRRLEDPGVRMIDFLRRWFQRDALDAELDSELRSHVQMREAQNRAEGMSEAEARAAARQSFGRVAAIKEQARMTYTSRFWETLHQDVRYALRGFRRNPAFTLTALLAITLGIGSTSAVFSVVDRILFRSLPYPNDHELVSVGLTTPIDANEFFFGPAYLSIKDSSAPFKSATSWTGATACDLTEANPVRLTCGQVEDNFLDVLGVRPFLGRGFTTEEDSATGPRAALISYGLWQSRFAGSGNAVGSALKLDGEQWTIVGVLPATFEVPTLTEIDVLVPQRMDRAAIQRNQSGRFMRVFARLNDRTSFSQARAALDPVLELALNDVPPQYRDEIGLIVRPLRDRQVGNAFWASWVLLAAVAAVLLIACLNVASLFLARASQRRDELAVRAALGAGKWRLTRQALTESLLLGVFGALGGWALAVALLKGFALIAPSGIPRLGDAELDGRVLGFTLVASIVSAVAFGLASCRRLPQASALSGARALGGSRLDRRYAMVAVQIAASMVLLSAAGLLVDHLRTLQQAPVGMDIERVATVELVLGRQFYSTLESRHSFFEAVEESLAKLPGVIALAVTDSVPPEDSAGGSHPLATLLAEGRRPIEEGTGGLVFNRWTTPGYFRALGIPILEGRGFREAERSGPASTLVLSQSLASTLFPGQSAVGKRVQFRYSEPPTWLEVIGVAGDVRNRGLSEAPGPEYYLLRNRKAQTSLSDRVSPARRRRAIVIIRSQLAPEALANMLRTEVAKLDSTLPIAIDTMEQRVGRLAARPRFNAMLLSLFALMGAVLTAIGLYGVTSFLVAQRRREIGLRMALGATTNNVVAMVLARALRWTVAGAALGLIGVYLSASALKALIDGSTSSDLWPASTAVAILATVAVVAAGVPALRASTASPTQALREE